jgi:hypothetical protein
MDMGFYRFDRAKGARIRAFYIENHRMMPYRAAFLLTLLYTRVIDCQKSKKRENYQFFSIFDWFGSASGGARRENLGIICV